MKLGNLFRKKQIVKNKTTLYIVGVFVLVIVIVLLRNNYDGFTTTTTTTNGTTTTTNGTTTTTQPEVCRPYGSTTTNEDNLCFKANTAIGKMTEGGDADYTIDGTATGALYKRVDRQAMYDEDKEKCMLSYLDSNGLPNNVRCASSCCNVRKTATGYEDVTVPTEAPDLIPNTGELTDEEINQRIRDYAAQSGYDVNFTDEDNDGSLEVSAEYNGSSSTTTTQADTTGSSTTTTQAATTGTSITTTQAATTGTSTTTTQRTTITQPPNPLEPDTDLYDINGNKLPYALNASTGAYTNYFSELLGQVFGSDAHNNELKKDIVSYLDMASMNELHNQQHHVGASDGRGIVVYSNNGTLNVNAPNVISI